MRFARLIAAGIITMAATLSSVGCNTERSDNSGAATRPASGESNTATTQQPATQNKNAQATTPAANIPAANPGESDGLPIKDAAAFRDRLLEIARSARPESQAAWANAEAIRNAWQKQYPSLKFSIFYSMAADPNTISASDAFLISGLTNNFDQLYAFAVADTGGRCAGGAAVIPGDNAGRKISDEKMPTVFKPIDMSNAKSCTGDDASKNYKP